MQFIMHKINGNINR